MARLWSLDDLAYLHGIAPDELARLRVPRVDWPDLYPTPDVPEYVLHCGQMVRGRIVDGQVESVPLPPHGSWYCRDRCAEPRGRAALQYFLSRFLEQPAIWTATVPGYGEMDKDDQTTYRERTISDRAAREGWANYATIENRDSALYAFATADLSPQRSCKYELPWQRLTPDDAARKLHEVLVVGQTVKVLSSSRGSREHPWIVPNPFRSYQPEGEREWIDLDAFSDKAHLSDVQLRAAERLRGNGQPIPEWWVSGSVPPGLTDEGWAAEIQRQVKIERERQHAVTGWSEVVDQDDDQSEGITEAA